MMDSKITLSERQLATLQNTLAKNCNRSEFNLFIEYCRNIGLDPIRKQVVPIIFNADSPSKRQMTLVVAIDGLRAIAARCGDYRPDEDEPEIIYKEELKSDTNPLGIEKALVRVWKQDNTGKWNRITGSAYWDEYAPVKQYGDNPAYLDSKTLWPTKGRVMIAKCAEAVALRKGWPDQFAGVYAEGEFDKSITDDAAASEIVKKYNESQRIKSIGGERQITFLLSHDIGLERFGVGVVADKFLEAAEKCKDINEFANLRATNKDSLREFWAYAASDALELKSRLEIIEEKLSQAELQQVERA